VILFDSHCHLQDRRYGSVREIIGRARESGVANMVCSAVNESDWKQVRSIAHSYPEVIPSFCMHPMYLQNRTGGWLERMEELLKVEARAGVGEIGIDRWDKRFNDQEQRDIFIDQLMLAKRLNRPVSIHCRKAWGQLIDIVRRTGLPGTGAMIHSYSGGPDLVVQLEKLGFYISFSGSVTRDRNHKGREAVKVVSSERLLIETDAPDMLPADAPGELNEPSFIRFTAESIAVLRGVTVEEIAVLTTENANRLFLL